MSKYVSVKNGDCGELRDADGEEIKYAIEADLESGIVTVFATDASGGILVEGDSAVTEVKRCKAPLRFASRGRWGEPHA